MTEKSDATLASDLATTFADASDITAAELRSQQTDIIDSKVSTADVGALAGGDDASDVPFTSGSGLDSTDVQAALDELQDEKQPLDADLTSFADNTNNGLVTRASAGNVVARTLTGTADQIDVTNGNGVSGNPTIAAVVASQAEAEAGTDTTKLMTALRTSQAIAALAGGGTDDQTAAEVPFTPAGNLASTDVQDALEELDSEKTATGVTSEIDDNVDDVITALGIAENATDFGTFTGDLFTDNQNLKSLLQEAEDAIEGNELSGTEGQQVTFDSSGDAVAEDLVKRVVLDLPETEQSYFAPMPFDGTVNRVRAFAEPSGQDFDLTATIAGGSAMGNVDAADISTAAASPTSLTPSSNNTGSEDDLIEIEITNASGSLTKAWVELRIVRTAI